VDNVQSVKELKTIVNTFSDAEHEECKGIVVRTHTNNGWTALIEHPLLRAWPTQDSVEMDHVLRDDKVAFAKGRFLEMLLAISLNISNRSTKRQRIITSLSNHSMPRLSQ